MRKLILVQSALIIFSCSEVVKSAPYLLVFEAAYEMYDLNGRYVGKGTILLRKNKVVTSLLQSGLYFIKISNARGTVIKKFIKK